MHPGKLGIATILAASALAAAGFAAAHQTPHMPAPAPAPTLPPVALKLVAGSTVRGRVVAPEGRAVAGASVRTIPNFNHPNPVTVVVTGSDGGFSLPVPPRFGQAEPMSPFRALLATAPGFGLGWTLDTHRPEVAIRLVPPGPPVAGQLVNEDGEPLAGVKVTARNLNVPIDPTTQAESGSLNAFLSLPESSPLMAGTRFLPFEAAATTDPNGRFAIRDVGPERVVVLVAQGPAIETTVLFATTRAGATINAARHDLNGTVHTLIQPAHFEQVIWPTRPITGVISDITTGQPLAGWKVEGATERAQSHVERDIEATTGADGRYTLTGLGRAKAYRIFLTPPPGQPYLPAGFRQVAAPIGPDPVRFDLATRRGVVVRGRVTDRQTGAPLAGYLNADAFLDNPHNPEFPGYAESNLVYRSTDADGRFEVVVPPGPSIVGFRARDEGRYRSGQGAEGIAGYDKIWRHFKTVGREMSPLNFHALAGVDAAPGTEAVMVNLTPDPSDTIELAVLDPEGRPLGGVEVEGANDFMSQSGSWQDVTPVVLRAFAPGSSRRVTVRHPGRKLVGSATIQAKDGSPQTLKLMPWGEIRGRLVNADGTPREHLTLVDGPLYPPGPRAEPIGSFADHVGIRGNKADAQGRFHVVGLVPGHHYGASALEYGEITVGELFDDVTVQPGEVKDLGDLQVRPFRPKPVIPGQPEPTVKP